MHNSSISTANYELLFGKASGKDNNNVRKLNLCLLYANYYQHCHKVNERNLACIEFTTKVNYKLRIENQVSGIPLCCFFAFSVLLMLYKALD